MVLSDSPRSLMTLGWSNSFMQAASRRKSSISERVQMATGTARVYRWDWSEQVTQADMWRTVSAPEFNVVLFSLRIIWFLLGLFSDYKKWDLSQARVDFWAEQLKGASWKTFEAFAHFSSSSQQLWERTPPESAAPPSPSRTPLETDETPNGWSNPAPHNNQIITISRRAEKVSSVLSSRLQIKSFHQISGETSAW